MDSPSFKPSGIPRLSRLPVPRSSAPHVNSPRTSPSRERLLADPGLAHQQLRTPSLEKVQALVDAVNKDGPLSGRQDQPDPFGQEEQTIAPVARRRLEIRPLTESNPPASSAGNGQGRVTAPRTALKSRKGETAAPIPQRSTTSKDSVSSSRSRIAPRRSFKDDSTAPKSERTSQKKESIGPTVGGTQKADLRPSPFPKPEKRKVSNSSAALRETIAKARAARKSSGRVSDFETIKDPFNQQGEHDPIKHALAKRVEEGRTTGRLNISAMGLTEIPQEVLKMYSFDTSNETGNTWFESVDLSRFVAADNELSELSDEVFPDFGSEQDQTSQFGGLELLDLRGNLLVAVPAGLRHLGHLTVLNLSNNRLSSSVFDILCQLATVKELRLSGNAFNGPLPASITQLRSLETLDIHQNSITDLPDNIGECSHLRVIDVEENQLESLPLERLSTISLVEVRAAGNKIKGNIVGIDHKHFPKLRVLKLSANRLTSLTEDHELRMPALEVLDVAFNRITALPSFEHLEALAAFNAMDNSVGDFPAGFTCLTKLKSANLSGNDLQIIDDQIAGMQYLESLNIASNPIKDKRFLTMSTEEMKKALEARKALHTDAESFPGPEEAEMMPKTLVRNGVLDVVRFQDGSINELLASEVRSRAEIKQIELSYNKLDKIPISLGDLARGLVSVNLSHNKLGETDYLDQELGLDRLQSLNLSNNGLRSLKKLLQFLQAPRLVQLDIAVNRLVSLPELRNFFPELRTLRASDNAISELTVEIVQGFQIFDVSGNEIGYLPPALGLLGGENGLRALEVQGNLFRVPRWDILEKGTDAVLSWLRKRIPESLD